MDFGTPTRLKKNIRFVLVPLFSIVFLCLIYNIYTLFFPVSTFLDRDSAEHMHTAYLLSKGERPYLDFLQNHPLQFHHFLVGVEKLFNISSTRILASLGRCIIFAHFLCCIAVFSLWTTKLLKERPKGLPWLLTLATSWALLDIYDSKFHWIWDLRPDFIAYGQTLLGLYFIYLWFDRIDLKNNQGSVLMACVGGGLIGLGNSILPKGIPFLAAFSLTTLFNSLSMDKATLLSKINRKNISILSLIGLISILSFIFGMIVDCNLSNIPITTWIDAVFSLNSRKHIIFTNNEVNPLSYILNAFSIPLPLSLFLITWIIWELIQSSNSRSRQNGFTTVLVFAVFTIIINFILPSYSSGVGWSYYFIPAFFSATGICILLLLRLIQLFNFFSQKKERFFSKCTLFASGVIISVLLLNHPMQFATILNARQSEKKEVLMGNKNDYTLNLIMPNDFVFFGHPAKIPTKSRHWGYYYMLSYDTGFWNDCYSLGLGPNPEIEWEKAFGGNPPDAIALTEPYEISRFIFMVKACQGLDVSWLLEEIEDNYQLMGGKGARFYILNRKVPVMESLGWRKLNVQN